MAFKSIHHSGRRHYSNEFPTQKIRQNKDHHFRKKLQIFAKEKIDLTRNGKGDQCIAFVEIVDYAENLRDSNGSKNNVVEDLKLVLIGDGLRTADGRGKGEYFAGQFKGSKGFKTEFWDKYNQVQHAMAGIYIPYKFGVWAFLFAKAREKEVQDDRLYDATLPVALGYFFNDNYDLPSTIAKVLCVNPYSKNMYHENFHKRIKHP